MGSDRTNGPDPEDDDETTEGDADETLTSKPDEVDDAVIEAPDQES